LLDELPDASGVAVDIEAGVLELAALNASALALENRLRLIESDCLSALSEDQQFDLIVSNPPYVTHDEELGPSVVEFEPHSALFVTDGDAMQFYKRIMLEAKQHLAPSGIIVFEIGANRQDDLTCAATECGYHIIEQRQDMCAIVRALSLKLIS
jgi:release factor glutamine methyltransferase